MNPQQPNQPQRPGTEYDFFMNPGQAPKPSPVSKLSGSSMVNRLLIVVGGLFVLVILFWIAASLLGGNSNEPNLVTVAQYQTELVRVAGQVNSNGGSQSSQNTKNFAQSVSLSVTSERQELLKFMATHGSNVNAKVLILKHNPQTDTALNNALAASNFDSIFKGIMRTQLTYYQTALKTAYTNAKNTQEKQILSNDFDDATLMLKQIGDPDQ